MGIALGLPDSLYNVMPWCATKSLQVRLTLAIVLLILGGLAALALVVAGRQEERLGQLLSGQQYSTAGYVAEDIDAKIRLRVDSLVRAALRLAEMPLGDELRLRQFLGDHLTIYELFELGLIVVKPDLNGAYGDFPELPGRRAADFRLAPYADVRRAATPAVGPPMLSREGGRPVVVIAVPVKDRDGRLLAILAGVTALDAANFLDLVARQRLGRTGDFLVVDPRHRVVVTGTEPGNTLRPLPAAGADAVLDRAAGGFEGSAVGIDADGIERLASTRRVPSAGWSVVATMPTAEAFAPVRELHRLLIGGAAGLAMLAGLTAALFLRRALAPLNRAALAFDRMTRGSEPLLALPIERADEVGRLVESFNRLQQSLNHERAALRDSEDKLRTLVQAIPDSVQFKDHQGRWLEYNAGAQRAFGLEGIDCRGRTERELAERVSGMARRALLQCQVTDEVAWQAGEPCRLDEQVPQPDGTTRVFDVIKVPLFGAGGRRKGMVVIGRDITEQRQAAEALKRSLQEFNSLVERIPVGVYKFRMRADGSQRFDYVSPRWCRLLGVEPDVVYESAEAAFSKVHPGDIESLRAANQRARETLEAFQWEGRVVGEEGFRWLHIESTPTVMANGDILWEGIQYDVSERRRAEENLQLVASVFRYAREGICITDAGERILDVNPTFCDMMGYAREEVIGKTPRVIKSGHHSRQFYTAMWDSINRRGFWRGEIWNRHRGGGLRVQLLTVSAVTDDEGQVTHYLGVFSDISQLKENEKQLERLAHYDALTGIPNRLLLADRLQQAIAQTRRSGALLAVCYLDLDEFKAVNDGYGHEAGDRLLVEVARRLQLAVRTGDTVARLGGDEFVFLLPGLDSYAECETIVERLIAELAIPYDVAAHSVTLVASIGIAMFPAAGVEPDTLLRHADEAMYAAKHAGGNRCRFYGQGDGSSD